SVNMALIRCLGPLDIILGAEGERIGADIRPNFRARLDAVHVRRPLSVAAALGIVPNWPKRVLRLQVRSYRDSFGPVVDHPHAAQVQAFDKQAWERHFKFTFVRNSYERMASLYLFLSPKSKEERDSFPVFVRKLIEGASPFERWQHIADPWPLYAIG